MVCRVANLVYRVLFLKYCASLTKREFSRDLESSVAGSILQQGARLSLVARHAQFRKSDIWNLTSKPLSKVSEDSRYEVVALDMPPRHVMSDV